MRTLRLRRWAPSQPRGLMWPGRQTCGLCVRARGCGHVSASTWPLGKGWKRLLWALLCTRGAAHPAAMGRLAGRAMVAGECYIPAPVLTSSLDPGATSQGKTDLPHRWGCTGTPLSVSLFLSSLGQGTQSPRDEETLLREKKAPHSRQHSRLGCGHATGHRRKCVGLPQLAKPTVPTAPCSLTCLGGHRPVLSLHLIGQVHGLHFHLLACSP